MAYAQAVRAFEAVLPDLVRELPLLRIPAADGGSWPSGSVAQRMAAAVWPHRTIFITPMAAVAGAVADHVLAALVAGRELSRAYVNDGGDIALHLTQEQVLTLGMAAGTGPAGIDGALAIGFADPVRGVATSGRSGRSFSLGIADAVTVLAATAAAADAAATLVANAIDLDHPAILRRPACALDPDSDLGQRLVTVEVGLLPAAGIARALDAGAACARRLHDAGLLVAAALRLRGEVRLVGPLPVLAAPPSGLSGAGSHPERR